ncbi:MAG: SET domain-containing protein-lysine N-methyltransferase [Actinobacteria bacterium]|nr:SET domain-containing protein-lysine N-methyltransferase [Actinomycetota bacterium]
MNGQPRILIYAIRDIHAFEELTYDYQFKVSAD